MIKKILNDTSASIVITALIFGVIFPALEAGSTLAQTTVTGSTAQALQVIARQQVTAEMSLTIGNTSLTMSPSIPGITGGTGNATTSMVIVTNNREGYNVTIQASGTGQVMKGETQGGYFGDYPSGAPQGWVNASAGQSSQFGFGLNTVSINSGGGNQANGYGGCGSATANDACFSRLSTSTATTIVNVTNATTTAYTTAAGDSFILKFRAQIPPNPNPIMPEDWYAATTTITATMN